MTVTNLYSSPGSAPRNRSNPDAGEHPPLVLSNSARLMDEQLRKAADPNLLTRDRSSIEPAARDADPLSRPAVDKEPPGGSNREQVFGQIDQVSTETAIDTPVQQNMLPVRWTSVPCSLILVARARGGIGATSFAANLALEMSRKRNSRQSRERKKVALVDFDVQFGTVATSLDLVDRGGLLKLLQLPRHPDTQAVRGALLTHESGVRVLAAPANPIPLEALDGPRVAAIMDALMADNDVVIVDMPPALISWIEPLLSRATRLLMVTNLAITSVTSARRMLNIIREDAPDLVVETVVSREHKPIIPGKLHREAAEAIGAPLAYWLPEETRYARLALDRGEPLTTFAPRSAWSRAVRNIAQSLDRAIPQQELQR